MFNIFIASSRAQVRILISPPTASVLFSILQTFPGRHSLHPSVCCRSRQHSGFHPLPTLVICGLLSATRVPTIITIHCTHAALPIFYSFFLISVFISFSDFECLDEHLKTAISFNNFSFVDYDSISTFQLYTS